MHHVVPVGDPFPHTWHDCPCVVHNAEGDRP